jgi:hypothetical protein
MKIGIRKIMADMQFTVLIYPYSAHEVYADIFDHKKIRRVKINLQTL